MAKRKEAETLATKEAETPATKAETPAEKPEVVIGRSGRKPRAEAKTVNGLTVRHW